MIRFGNGDGANPPISTANLNGPTPILPSKGTRLNVKCNGLTSL